MSSSSGVTELHNIRVFSKWLRGTVTTSATRSPTADGCNKIGEAFYRRVSGLVECDDGAIIRLQVSKRDGANSTGHYYDNFKLDTTLTADLELSQEVFDKLDGEWNDVRSYHSPIVPVTLTPEQVAQRAANEAVAILCQQKAEDEERKRMEERLKKEYPTVPGLRA